MDAVQAAALSAAVTTPIASLLTLAATKGVDAYVKVRKTQTDESHYEDQRIDENWRLLVGKQEGRLEKLEADLEYSREQHLECIKNQGRLEGRIEELERRVYRHDQPKNDTEK